jgi:uroporphyrinogen-III synthase
LGEALRAAGASVLECAATRIEWFDPSPLQRAMAQLHGGDWLVCTSANGVRAIARAATPLSPEVSVAAVGESTAQAFAEAGVRVDLLPGRHDAAGLVAELTARAPMQGVRVCFPCAVDARPTLVDGLLAAGALVEPIVCYASRPDESGLRRLADALGRGVVDLITLAAPSAVHAVATVMTPPDRCAVVVIGPVTSAAAFAAGLRVVAEAADASVPAMVHAIVQCRASGAALSSTDR